MPASTLPVSGPRTTARSSMTRPQVGHAAPMTSKVRHSSVLQGMWRDRPRGAFVRRMPTPGGEGLRHGGRGLMARCHRCLDASAPPRDGPGESLQAGAVPGPDAPPAWRL
jgi:hypothetical protein